MHGSRSCEKGRGGEEAGGEDGGCETRVSHSRTTRNVCSSVHLHGSTSRRDFFYDQLRLCRASTIEARHTESLSTGPLTTGHVTLPAKLNRPNDLTLLSLGPLDFGGSHHVKYPWSGGWTGESDLWVSFVHPTVVGKHPLNALRQGHLNPSYKTTAISYKTGVVFQTLTF